MNQQTITILITMMLTIALTVLLLYVLPKYKGKYNKVLIDRIAETVTLAIGELLKANDSDKDSKSVQEIVYDNISELVLTSERLPQWNKEFQGLTKEELNIKQHKYVKDAVINILKVNGIELNPMVNKLIDNVIDITCSKMENHNDEVTVTKE